MSIATLPPELLIQIFVHHVAAHRVGREGSLPPYSWIYIAHVNQYWRAIALSCTKFWTYVPLVRPQCVETLLARSGQAHLTLTFGPCGLWGGDFRGRTNALVLALSQLSRVTRFKILGIWSRCAELDALKNAPALECLELDGYPFMWKDVMFEQPRLKKLVVKGSSDRFSSPLQIKEMLGALEGMPTLEVLILVSVMPVISSTWAESETAITLPRLQFLHIWDESYEMCLLLDKIIFPTTARIYLELCMAQSEAEFVQLSGSLSLKLDGETAIGTVQPLLALDIGQYGDQGYTQVRGWRTTRPVDTLKARTDSPSLTVRFGGVCPPVGELTTFCDGLPLESLQTLSMDSLDYLGGTIPNYRQFGWARNVDTVWLSQWSASDMLDAGLFDIMWCPSQRQHLLSLSAFPRLTTLRLDDTICEGYAESLAEVLEYRHQKGGLKLLIVREFDELKKLYIRLRDITTEPLAVLELV